ncbi:uncharacterized protein LOC125496906 [Beta vulgaris subsp. vulgaris]|uniref:uncharacterized protein LOC125496906 n=1 Tax=Beta vulgaris subsp. vulgaris TaxID=3555 RepID=UPI00203674CC|nr:uncharacterized protein LOC125496906 [Beta vulgaris subsp. vulgaris]XP_048498899.1 uncharacterized protein LOC125496906 [Beta vulgaris subsp. vulgaris]XP_048498900.1 uncharacterized protein LOC125496906 [Beta vulgaris subsp. vulgaris]XP_048498901.1 uncharacterized protein LOC125496906 [Beta vulgaris subsp. vulgaris]XP_057250219.1 uncharacterized protein LOC125496906 [Beta vulgaris subsp. vulgaris]
MVMDILDMTEVPQDVWDLQCFRCISSPSALYCISCYFSRKRSQDKIQEILLAVLVITNYQKQNDELSNCLSGDLQEILCSLKTLKPNNMPLSILPPKVTDASSSSQKPFRYLDQVSLPLDCTYFVSDYMYGSKGHHEASNTVFWINC